MERQERQRQQRQKDKDREIEQEMERKFITADDLDSAEEESERTGKSIFDILKRRKGYVIITQGQPICCVSPLTFMGKCVINKYVSPRP